MPRLLLAVEDDPTVFAIVRRTLRDLPVRLVWARSAEEALEIIRMQVPAVIVSDHQLPGMTGLELLEQVRARWPGVPAVLHTGDAGAQALAAERRLEVVEKGAPATSLRAVVETLLHGGA